MNLGILQLELDYARNRLLSIHPGPWYLEQSNSSGVVVRDVQGNIVFEEVFSFGPEMGPNQIETITRGADLLARYLVTMSEYEHFAVRKKN